MWFPEELWREICGFLIHNITKHGKHLKIYNKNIVNFNKVVQDLPKKYIPENSPRIVFGSNKHCYRIVKFLYNIKISSWNTYKLIIEYIPYNHTERYTSARTAYYRLLT